MGGMWPDVIVVGPPALDYGPSLGEAHEDFLVEAFIAELTVERFHEGILGWFTWRDIMPLDTGSVRPFQHGPRR